ncbi:Thiol-disulfide isomerase or thioredoxin [Polaromonas sp. OV174]|uniref:TlpA family protein disulfide reductase n=1 Tax=Polaromonas sp. OV174 TaxID=1855300 RepID=UPI0008DF9ABF|nr:TlpA disulfide reductase family protein [Polaromonas sp. OV174]SFC41397.1 Thiol-disulfide isomerase or thioredoxin [Polaromonas sp. OV174]
MLTVNVGPFPVSVGQLTLLAALLCALAVGHLLGRRQGAGGIGSTLSDMLLIGALVARLTFVALWFEVYRSDPWGVLDIRDGGFSAWAGVLAAALVALWQGRRRPALRKPLLLGLLAGALVWGSTNAALRLNQPEQAMLPQVALTALSGQSVDLAGLAQGRPLVLNLWASWCPPCRREMPVLAAAQQQTPGVRFVFANQGEEAGPALRYLATSQLVLANVVLDPAGALGKSIGSRALPTTLFYDASGRLVDTHLGELSAASLASKLQQLGAR